MKKDLKLFILNDVENKLIQYNGLLNKANNNISNKDLLSFINIKKDLESNAIYYQENLIEVIKFYQRTFDFILKQHKLTNISLNHGEYDDVCDILNDCNDMINSCLLITDLNHKESESNLIYKNLRKEENNNVYYFHINDLSELNDINKLIERIRREKGNFNV